MSINSEPSSDEDFVAPRDPKEESSTRDASNNTGADSNPSSEAEEQLAKKETSAVFRLRMLVFLVMLIAAVAVSLVVYFITANAEQEQFAASFHGSSIKVINSFEEIVSQKLGAIASLAVSFTSYARSQNNTWPLVTMNDFQQRAASARALSDAYFLELLPLVTNETRLEWEEYAQMNKGWLDEGRAYQDSLGIGVTRRMAESLTGENVLDFVAGEINGSSPIADQIFLFDENWAPIPDPGDGPYFPIWESSPILTSPRDLVNYNLMFYPDYARYVQQAFNTGEVAIGGLDTAEPGGVTHPDLTTSFFAFIISFTEGELVEYEGDPMSSVYIPVFDSYDDDKNTVAVLLAVIKWATYFEGILPPNADTLTVVLDNSCEDPHTYVVSGTSVVYIGVGDLHDPSLSYLEQSTTFSDLIGQHEGAQSKLKLNEELCEYSLYVYPTPEMYDHYHTSMPIIITFSVAMVFVFTAVMFVLYDRLVERRQRLVMSTALRSNAIVSSLFPQQIRDRLFAEEQEVTPLHGTKTKLRTFLTGDATEKKDDVTMYETKPIADLFPDTTVMFADIVGFTAWSSVREPSQVFTLLETLYRAFDEIAARRRVFKVETVGDCYVAVSGLPDPRKDHAVVMARFAKDCLYRMINLTKRLETSLGPDTGDLRVRVGLHSGPVTAGVLRGERSRFQLFGDTMNTAARIESTGRPGYIHTSQETAALLNAAGKDHWIRLREDLVYAKGKGQMQTYWLDLGTKSDQNTHSTHSTSDDDESEGEDDAARKEVEALRTDKKTAAQLYRLSSGKNQRLIDWNVDVLSRLLKRIVARRKCMGRKQNLASADLLLDTRAGETVLDEVVEIIHLPAFNHKAASKQEEPDKLELGNKVVDQLRDYVANLASLYRENPFHNFEHASHVTMSVVKLLSRIVAPSDFDFENNKHASVTLHDHTYGITSDPLTQFACVLSALIHDVDHVGVPNTQLVKENSSIAAVYNGKSIAEQNSVDIAWELLMDGSYRELRSVIYSDETEMKRFRQLVVNSVMATDIMDKDLKERRNGRWDKAFKEKTDEGTSDAINRKATIVIEHLIQASDVSHTMQHWSVYRKWNQRLFEEMYKAYKEGRAEKDPSEFWYKGEMGFFDFYIIPLAKKLKDCGVFGVSSDEYLNYAVLNRREWETKGQEVVAEMLEKCRGIWDHGPPLESAVYPGGERLIL